MSNNWRNLPNEILNIVFLYVKKSDKSVTHKKDLSQCALTCRSWRDASQTAFFSDVYLHAKGDINKLFPLFLANSGLKNLIKSLFADSLDISMLFLLDLQFPNLESLKFSGDNLLYSSFTKMITENGNFKNLRNLPVPKNEEQDRMYLQCVNFLKDGITTLILYHGSNYSRNAVYMKLFKQLNHFPKLEKVVVRITAPVGSRVIYYSQQFMEKIGFITKSNLSSFKQLLISSLNDQHYFCLHLSRRRDSLGIVTYDDRDIFNLDDGLMVLIMDSFPNLNHIYFRRYTDENQKATMMLPHSPTSNVTFQFAKYLSKIYDCRYDDNVMYSEAAINIIKYICDNSSKKNPAPIVISNFLLFSSDFVPPAIRKLYNSRHYSQSSFNQSLSSIMFNKENRLESQHKMTFTTFLEEKDGYGNSNNQMQLKEIIEKIGHFLNTMVVQISPNTDLNTLLNYTAVHCSQLSILGISGLLSLSQKTNNNSSKDEKIRTCSTVTVLFLHECIPTPGNFVCILKHFPSLKRLTLKNCFTQNSWCGERYYSISLPNATLTSLEISMDENFSNISKSETYYYLKLVTDVGSKARYCCLIAKYGDKGIVGYSVLTSITESDFQESIVNKDMSSCLIYCKSVDEFTIRYTAAENGHATRFTNI